MRHPRCDLSATLHSLSGQPYHLLIARPALDPSQIKYFLSNAPESTPVETLLRVAFTRWTIERAFEDSKTELGMDHFEVRQYRSIQRHLILTCLSHVFLSEFCIGHRGGGNPDVTVCQVRTAAAKLVPLWIIARRCSHKYAQTLGEALTVTQQRNAKARRCHRRRTVRRLHAVGIFLKDTIPCYQSHL